VRACIFFAGIYMGWVCVCVRERERLYTYVLKTHPAQGVLRVRTYTTYKCTHSCMCACTCVRVCMDVYMYVCIH